jgi:hypothetical protein
VTDPEDAVPDDAVADDAVAEAGAVYTLDPITLVFREEG